MGLDGSMDLKEEGRMKMFLLQVRAECGILDRMIYKNKNQHRRCPYFQSLLKVRRDVKLLLSVGLEEILKSAFHIIHEKNPEQRIYLLERLKERHSGGKHNFQKRLLGVARLLSQMIEPILRAAIQISSLLAKSFFMAFSLTILSLLARLRVLVQQMLVDTVSVFNTVSSLSQTKQTAKIIKNGVEAFKEYYPPREVISLDCPWQGDKFVLLERTHVSEVKELEDGGVASLEAPDIQYETLEASDADEFEALDKGHEAYSRKTQREFMIEKPTSSLATRQPSDTSADAAGNANSRDDKDEENTSKMGPSAEPPYKVVSRVSSSGKTRKMAAFIPVKATSETIKIRPKKMKLDDSPDSHPLHTNEAQDSFFNLLTSGSLKSSIFHADNVTVMHDGNGLDTSSF